MRGTGRASTSQGLLHNVSTHDVVTKSHTRSVRVKFKTHKEKACQQYRLERSSPFDHSPNLMIQRSNSLAVLVQGVRIHSWLVLTGHSRVAHGSYRKVGAA